MNINQLNQVKEFMTIAGQLPNNMSEKELFKQRYSMQQEEFDEFVFACVDENRVEQLDALCDLCYVVLGSFLAFELELPNIINSACVYDFFNFPFFKYREEWKTTLQYYCEEILLFIQFYVEKNGFESVFDEAFSRVHTSNLSKFCTSKSEAHETVSQYMNLYSVESTVKKVGDYFVVIRDDGKVLKSINYKAVQLEDLV